MSVHKKLMEARIELQNTKLGKSGMNKFAGFSYFELGDFLPATMQIFANLGLCGVVSFGKEEAKLTIVDIEDNSTIEITSPMASASLKGCHEIQNLGASQTYLRRYLWVTAMEIVEHDALDSTTGKDKPVAKSVPAEHWDSLEESIKRRLQGIADEVIACISSDNMDGAMAVLAELVEVEEKTALWSRLDSKTRSTIKKYQSTLENK